MPGFDRSFGGDGSPGATRVAEWDRACAERRVSTQYGPGLTDEQNGNQTRVMGHRFLLVGRGQGRGRALAVTCGRSGRGGLW